MKGIKRFRQAIMNQRDLGNGEFRLTYHDAEEIAEEIEEESGWAAGVPAPVDADGEVVPLTTLQMYDGDGNCGKVCCYDSFFYNQALRAWFVSTDLAPARVSVAALHLHRPDSWERLEEDAKLAPRDYLQGRGMNPDKTDRIKTITTDIVRRAKALAERDAKGAER